MIWLKAVLTGVVGALLAAVLAIVVTLIYVTWATRVWTWDGTGSGGIGFVSFGIVDAWVFLYLTMSFALAFWWSLRRQRSRTG
jgi:hypothetical protein